MKFFNRDDELARLTRLNSRPEGGFAVLYGRRRIGKTRLLLEWAARDQGLYTVADKSACIQRRYLASAMAERVRGFADVEYPDWTSLLTRLARDLHQSSWRGPIIIDELPNLVETTPELPGILQHWIDHDARRAQLVFAVAGSSQRVMQRLVLSAASPLYGRVHELLPMGPLEPVYLAEVFGLRRITELIETYAAWGGVPRYWELASELSGAPRERVDQLVLDPSGLLHHEPDRLLRQELPLAANVRPVLDAIGMGAHRVSEIAGRLGHQATSMGKPLERLLGMGLIRRETPFGEAAKGGRRSLYKIDDPFFRLWFRVVAPHRGQLASGSRGSRMKLLNRFWEGLVSESWEELCRDRLPRLSRGGLAETGPWGPASRWWHRGLPDWEIVSDSEDGSRLLLGEARWSRKPHSAAGIKRLLIGLASKPPPQLPKNYAQRRIVRALFVPQTLEPIEPDLPDMFVVTAAELLHQ